MSCFLCLCYDTESRDSWQDRASQGKLTLILQTRSSACLSLTCFTISFAPFPRSFFHHSSVQFNSIQFRVVQALPHLILFSYSNTTSYYSTLHSLLAGEEAGRCPPYFSGRIMIGRDTGGGQSLPYERDFVFCVFYAYLPCIRISIAINQLSTQSSNFIMPL